MNAPLTIFPMAKPVPEGAGDFHLPSAEQSFVLDTITTRVGEVPRVGSKLYGKDKRGHYLVRWNIGRDHFSIEPGLYAIGEPTDANHVLVTANYKMTFDLLRQAMAGRSLWILVLDTKGINVWCAAGEGTFGSEELIDRIQASRLKDVVNHRKLIVPQLGATGVAAFEVKKYSGFSVTYGPVMLQDLPTFLDNGCKATPEMRIKQFPFKERLVLIPVDIMLALKQGIPIILVFLLTAGFAGDGPFLQTVISHGLPPSLALLIGIVAGTIVVPLLLPWIPGRAFSVKGALCGLLLFALLFQGAGLFAMDYSMLEKCSWLLITLAVSSWFGMAFTGASTFTSLNGVRKEMLRAMPIQFLSIISGFGLWVTALWLG
ncbi:MAG: mercury methylation corrinoid protein HgcA [Thermodesulfobacteriota bacterium]|nr:mercury methylation corrinoid protein HgcA [Thermodesulfobacteriota bacterium]